MVNFTTDSKIVENEFRKLVSSLFYKSNLLAFYYTSALQY